MELWPHAKRISCDHSFLFCLSTQTHTCLLHKSLKVRHLNHIQTSVTKPVVCFENALLLQAQRCFIDFISQQQPTRTVQMALQSHTWYSFCTLLEDEYHAIKTTVLHISFHCVLFHPHRHEVGRQLTTQQEISHIFYPERELPSHYVTHVCSSSYLFSIIYSGNHRYIPQWDLEKRPEDKLHIQMYHPTRVYTTIQYKIH